MASDLGSSLQGVALELHCDSRFTSFPDRAAAVAMVPELLTPRAESLPSLGLTVTRYLLAWLAGYHTLALCMFHGVHLPPLPLGLGDKPTNGSCTAQACSVSAYPSRYSGVGQSERILVAACARLQTGSSCVRPGRRDATEALGSPCLVHGPPS